MTGFMQQEIVKGDWIEIDGSQGVVAFPAEHYGVDQARAEYDGDIFVVVTRKGAYGARMSAPGYMDCTDWMVFKTLKEARAALNEMFSDED